MRVLALLLTLLASTAFVATPAGLSIVPRSFEYELNQRRGAAVPLRIDVANEGPEQEAWVLVVVHEASTGAEVELYSQPLVVPAGGRARFDAQDGLSVRLARDGIYTLTAIVFTAGPDGDLRADTLHEPRPIYVGSAQRKACHR